MAEMDSLEKQEQVLNDNRDFLIKLDEKKIGNFKMGIGIAEKSRHKTRRDRWGGNACKPQIPILTLCQKFLFTCSVILK